MRFVLLPFLLSLSALGCGGSSSETPPPLLPDPTSERYTGPRMPSATDDVALAPATEPEEDDPADLPRKPAAATWGSGKAASAPAASAPSMTSPTALPSSSATAPASSATAPASSATAPTSSATTAPKGSAAPPPPRPPETRHVGF